MTEVNHEMSTSRRVKMADAALARINMEPSFSLRLAYLLGFDDGRAPFLGEEKSNCFTHSARCIWELCHDAVKDQKDAAVRRLRSVQMELDRSQIVARAALDFISSGSERARDNLVRSVSSDAARDLTQRHET